MQSLIQKYNVPGPRYTSYPTVPYWDATSFSLAAYKKKVFNAFKESNQAEGISLYIHLPYCESMCTFCGCNKRITKNHLVEIPYIKTLLKELDLYIKLFQSKPKIKQLHLGGGTPTFFSAENLDFLMKEIFLRCEVATSCEFSFEGHPNNTTEAHLKTLALNGFTRVCYGVQDYNLTVQKAINRVQPFKNVLNATTLARKNGYTSVGHDIIYGLPFQTKEDVVNTIKKTIELKPDRIAFYSYAHVPWIKGNGQRGFSEAHLPNATEKRAQYEIGKNKLLEAGYVEIGMDHFTLKTDTLYKAQEQGTLHRNFMGYAASKTQLMIGLGVSAISDSWYSFGQNAKDIKTYFSCIKNNELPVFRGHILTNEDLIIRKHILNLMCRFETSWREKEMYFPELPDVLIKLKELEKDGLVALDSNKITVTPKGKPYVRNICLPFDLRLQAKKPDTKLFSMTV